jgi:hypothetical protein
LNRLNVIYCGPPERSRIGERPAKSDDHAAVSIYRQGLARTGERAKALSGGGSVCGDRPSGRNLTGGARIPSNCGRAVAAHGEGVPAVVARKKTKVMRGEPAGGSADPSHGKILIIIVACDLADNHATVCTNSVCGAAEC